MMYKINASKITPKLEDNAETVLVGSGIRVGSLFSVGIFAEEVPGPARVTALAVVVTDTEEAGAGTEDVTTRGGVTKIACTAFYIARFQVPSDIEVITY